MTNHSKTGGLRAEFAASNRENGRDQKDNRSGESKAFEFL
jgi:hypothetical protein